MRVPRNLAETAAGEPDVRAWVSDLPGVVASLAESWSLTLGEPYEPGGYVSWVAPAVGSSLVLKVGWRHAEAEGEAEALRLWAGEGAVLLHDEVVSERTIALLLERCVPGTPLRDAVGEETQDEVVAGVLRRLWRAPVAGSAFSSLASMCAEWAAEFEERYSEERYSESAGALDPGLVRDGLAVMRELPLSAADAVVLCTDLHAGNVLAAEREPWLAIDPKPFVGDPAYDVVQHLLNCPERLVADPEALVRRVARLLDLDPRRVRQWVFARCVQESLDLPFAAVVARKLGRVV